MPPDPAQAAAAPSRAPVLFGSAAEPPAAAPAPTPRAAPAATPSPVQRAQQSPDARAATDRDAGRDFHEDAVRRAGYGAAGERWRDPNDGKSPHTLSEQAGREGRDATADAIKSDSPFSGADDVVKFNGLELKSSEVRELLAHKAEQDLRKTQIPATPAEYKVELPGDYKMPAGVNFELVPEGPAIDALREWSRRQGLSQQQFSEALGLYASARTNEAIQINDAARREREKLGTSGPQRIDAELSGYAARTVMQRRGRS
jgi:hypothetical protein